MRRHTFLISLVGGAALAVSGCPGKVDEPDSPTEQERPPDPPPPEDPPGTPSPDDPIPDPDDEGAAGLPSWEDVESGHPAGATNPPMPVLVVTPDGDCFKDWRSPFDPRSRPPGKGEVREDCDQADVTCGTAVACPDRAEQVLEDWKAAKDADGAD